MVLKSCRTAVSLMKRAFPGSLTITVHAELDFSELVVGAKENNTISGYVLNVIVSLSDQLLNCL